MDLTEREVLDAEGRMAALRAAGHAVSARYDRRHRHLVVALHTGVSVTVPIRLVEGLAEAAPRSLDDIEISPSGLGLHWPRIDADVYLPSLLRGVFGSAAWMERLATGTTRDGGGREDPRRLSS